MKKINKKTIIYVCIIILITGIYYFFIKKDDYIEDISNTNTLILNEGSSEKKDNIIDTKKKNNIVVYITGQVKDEGIYELEENSRISDAIDKAGGLTEEADIRNINLAYMLEDGTKIYIPKKDENITDNNSNSDMKNNNGYISNNSGIGETKDVKTNSQNSKVNINTASQTELETLPGIGPSTALKIIEYRKENGKFTRIEDIKNVSGIGESKYNKVKDLIKV